MTLRAYLTGLDREKREMILGRPTDDPLHEAFAGKRVVHAGLLGTPIKQEEQQEFWQKAMAQPADASRQHAVYIHIPFCQTKCLYCGFYQQASRQQVEDTYIEMLLKEITHDAKQEQIRTARIDSVFLGGGTPSSLSPANARKLLTAIQENFQLAPGAEVTMEGRIHDLVPEKINTWLECGVNRISLGVQSFDTALRRRVGRIDTREEILRRLALLRKKDVTIIADLIYGLPGQDLTSWMADIRTLAEADVDGMDLYQLNIFPGGDLERALNAGRIPACADLAEQADLYLAARDQLLREGTERLSLCHWRRHRRERSCYNTMVKSGAVVYPFGCGAGGNLGGLSFMQQRGLAAYQQAVARGEKPILMMAHQLEAGQQRLCDNMVSDLEKGFVDFRRLSLMDARLEELELLLHDWQKKGLMQEDLGIYRLTRAGEFWYISMTQSLLECAQVIWQENHEQDDAPDATKGDALSELLMELLPDVSLEERTALLQKMPAPVRMMLKNASRDALRTMLSGMPPAALASMLGKSLDDSVHLHDVRG